MFDRVSMKLGLDKVVLQFMNIKENVSNNVRVKVLEYLVVVKYCKRCVKRFFMYERILMCLLCIEVRL